MGERMFDWRIVIVGHFLKGLTPLPCIPVSIFQARRGGWGTPLHGLYRYVGPKRVWFFCHFRHKWVGVIRVLLISWGFVFCTALLNYIGHVFRGSFFYIIISKNIFTMPLISVWTRQLNTSNNHELAECVRVNTVNGCCLDNYIVTPRSWVWHFSAVSGAHHLAVAVCNFGKYPPSSWI